MRVAASMMTARAAPVMDFLGMANAGRLTVSIIVIFHREATGPT